MFIYCCISELIKSFGSKYKKNMKAPGKTQASFSNINESFNLVPMGSSP